MYRPPPLRGRSCSQSKKILRIDLCQATGEARAAVLRDHGIQSMTTEPKQLAAYLERSDWSAVQPRCRYPHQGSCGVDRPHVKKSSLVSAMSLPEVFSPAIETFSWRGFPRFKTREKALWHGRE